MSKQTVSTNGQTTVTTVKAKVGRQTVQDRILQIVSEHPKGLEVGALEMEAQKLRTVPKGRYAGVAVSEFMTRKEGERTFVLPDVSERGLRIAQRCATQRKWLHWIGRHYPDRVIAQATADKLNDNQLGILREVLANNKKQRKAPPKAKSPKSSKKQASPAK